MSCLNSLNPIFSFFKDTAYGVANGEVSAELWGRNLRVVNQQEVKPVLSDPDSGSVGLLDAAESMMKSGATLINRTLEVISPYAPLIMAFTLAKFAAVAQGFPAPECAELPEEDLVLCRPDQFRCLRGECIPNFWVNDGEFDCCDQSDEGVLNSM